MKFQWLVALIFMTGWTVQQAHASKSRLDALGQDDLGSYYLDDDRNVFLNPAHVAFIREQLLMEWGAGGNTADAPVAGTTKQEGGLFKKGRFAYGLYLGQEDKTIATGRLTANGDLLIPDNTLDLFVGKDSGSEVGDSVAWGANLSYSNNQDESTAVKKTESFIRLKGGVAYGKKVEGYGHLYLKDEAEGGASEDQNYKGNLGISLGGSFRFMEDLKAYARFTTLDADYQSASGAEKDSVALKEFTVGVARIVPLEGKDFYFYSAEFNNRQESLGAADRKYNRIPIIMGVESYVKDWLVLRGSVKQNVLLNEKKEESPAASATSTEADTTTVAGGLSFFMNHFRFDGSFSTSTAQLNASNLMSRVAMIYSF